MTTKLDKLKEEENNSFDRVINTLNIMQLDLFRVYIQARHKRELEQLGLL